jgi:hypothetical protein
MGKPSAPKAPDPAALAREQAEANRVTTFSPFGNVNFGTVGEDGSFIPSQGGQAAVQINPTDLQTDTLGLQQQTENDIARQLGQRVSSLPTDQIDISGLPELRTDFSDQAQELERATFDRAMGLLSPVFDQREGDLRNQLAQRGLPVGSEAADAELNLFGQNRSNAELAAAQDAVGLGRQEQSRLFGLTQGARNQGLSETSFLRNQPFNELSAALSGSQLGQFQANPVQAQPVDVLGANALQQQSQLANFNAQNQFRSDALSGLFGLGAAALPAIPFSDRRLKMDIRKVGKTDDGLNVYTYRYITGGPVQMGVMADEVEKVKPEAVGEINGFKAVNYGMIANG